MAHPIKTFEDFAREAEQYKSILREYKTSKKVFIDKNFNKEQIFRSDTKYKEEKWNWYPIDKYFSAPLFNPKVIKPEYIIKGNWGDDSFLSALARTARQPYLVRLLFDRETPKSILGADDDLTIDLGCGAVVVYFHAFGRKTPVLIDTTVPFKVGTMNPHFSHPSQLTYSPWFTLVEKAYMKLKGSYTNVSRGLSKAIFSLFGYYSIEKNLSDFDTKLPLFERLMKYQRKDCVMGAMIRSFDLNGVSSNDLKDLGLIEFITYLIHKVRIEDGHELLCLQNLFDQSREWLGDWSDTSELWTPALKKKLQMHEADDGQFWISSQDFVRYFSQIEVCKPIYPNWTYYTFKLHIEPGPKTDRSASDIFRSPPSERYGFEIRPEQPIPNGTTAKFHFIIQRETDSDKNANLGTIIIKGRSYSSRWSSSLLQQSSIEMTSDNSSVILVIFRNEASRQKEDCYIGIFSETEFEIYQEQSSTVVATIQKQKPKGFVFDNFSRNHQVAPRIKVENIDGEDYFTMADELMGSLYENETHDSTSDALCQSLTLSTLKREQDIMHRKAEDAERRALELKKEKLRKERELEEKKKEVDEQIAKRLEEKRIKRELKAKRERELEEQKRQLQAEIDAAKRRLKEEYKRNEAIKKQPEVNDSDIISSSPRQEVEVPTISTMKKPTKPESPPKDPSPKPKPPPKEPSTKKPEVISKPRHERPPPSEVRKKQPEMFEDDFISSSPPETVRVPTISTMEKPAKPESHAKDPSPKPKSLDVEPSAKKPAPISRPVPKKETPPSTDKGKRDRFAETQLRPITSPTEKTPRHKSPAADPISKPAPKRETPPSAAKGKRDTPTKRPSKTSPSAIEKAPKDKGTTSRLMRGEHLPLTASPPARRSSSTVSPRKESSQGNANETPTKAKRKPIRPMYRVIPTA